MSLRSTAILVALIVAALILDLSFGDGAATLFVLRKFADLIEWLAFWR